MSVDKKQYLFYTLEQYNNIVNRLNHNKYEYLIRLSKCNSS